MSAFGDLIVAAHAAINALQDFQDDNLSPAIAKDTADKLMAGRERRS